MSNQIKDFTFFLGGYVNHITKRVSTTGIIIGQAATDIGLKSTPNGKLYTLDEDSSSITSQSIHLTNNVIVALLEVFTRNPNVRPRTINFTICSNVRPTQSNMERIIGAAADELEHRNNKIEDDPILSVMRGNDNPIPLRIQSLRYKHRAHELVKNIVLLSDMISGNLNISYIMKNRKYEIMKRLVNESGVRAGFMEKVKPKEDTNVIILKNRGKL